jgi:hypothetical protein
MKTHFSRLDIAKCLNGKHFVVKGNSVSRHIFFSLLSTLNGGKEEITQEFREEEKKIIQSCDEELYADSCDEKESKYYPNGKKHVCVYNKNHKHDCRSNWQWLSYQGSLAVQWTVDWDLGSIQSSLGMPNSVVTGIHFD